MRYCANCVFFIKIHILTHINPTAAFFQIFFLFYYKVTVTKAGKRAVRKARHAEINVSEIIYLASVAHTYKQSVVLDVIFAVAKKILYI